MKGWKTWMGTLLACAAAAGGQTVPTAPANPLAQQTEAKIRQITARMVELDASIESQVKTITDYLATVKDSADSRGRVAQIKKDFLLELKKSVDVYSQLRARRLDELGRRSLLSAEEIEKSTDVLDARIETRVGEIMEVARSFGESTGAKTYETVYDDGYWRDRRGRYDRHDRTDTRETAESVQRRQEAARGREVEDKIVAGLAASIKAAENTKLELTTRLPWATTEEQKAAIRNEIQEVDATIARRKQQIADLQEDRSGAGSTVDQRAAFQLDQRLDEHLASLKQQFRELYALAMQRQNEVLRLKSMQVR